MSADMQAEVSRVMHELVQIEERIAELAYLLTDEDKRDRLQWFDQRTLITERRDATVFHPRSIACRWGP